MAGIMVPLYSYPGPLWNQLIAQRQAHPSVPMAAIINPDSGPGASKDSNYATGIAQLVAAGIKVIGYVWCGEHNEFKLPSEPTYDCTQDVSRWKSWYPQITGIFVDGFQGGYSATGEAQVARARAAGYSLVVGNPGMNVAESLLASVDLACIYESAGYPGNTAALAAQHGAGKCYVLVYGVASVDSAWVRATENNYAWVYITNDVPDNPWDTLPPFFETEVAAYAAPGWLTGWAQRLPYKLDHTRIGAQANFQVPILMGAASGLNGVDLRPILTALGNNKLKLAVTLGDGVTQCKVEVNTWSSLQALLFALVPSISATDDTVLYIYYDPTQADNTTYVGPTGSTPAKAVWADPMFASVFHLTEKGANGTIGEYKDSTPLGNHATGASGHCPTQGGVGQLFDCTKQQYIIVPDNDAYSIPTTGKLALQFLMQPSVVDNPTAYGGTDNAYVRPIGKCATQAQYEYHIAVYSKNNNPTRSQRISFYIDAPSVQADAGDYTQNPFNAGDILLITGTASSATKTEKIYRDNALRYNSNPDGDTWPSYGVVPQNLGGPILIGQGILNNGDYFQGSLGEVRILTGVPSTAWISATNYALKDQLITYGVIENDPSGSNTFVPGAAKTATVRVSVTVAGLACTAELFLGDTTKAATSGPIPFVSSVTPEPVSLPIVMPAASGVYHVYIDVLYNGAVFAALQATEDVTIISGTVQPPVWA